MKKKHTIVELPAQKADMDKIISDENHEIKHVAFSSAVLNGEVKHYALVVWHDAEYGDHLF